MLGSTASSSADGRTKPTACNSPNICAMPIFGAVNWDNTVAVAQEITHALALSTSALYSASADIIWRRLVAFLRLKITPIIPKPRIKSRYVCGSGTTDIPFTVTLGNFPR